MAKKTASKSKTVKKKPARKPAPRPAAKAGKPKASAVAVKPRKMPVPIVRKPAPPADVEIKILTEDDLRKVKTGLSKKDLDYFRHMLLEKRAELLGDVASLEDAANTTGGDLSNMPLHMADVGTENYTQEFNLGLVESEKRLLAEINAALIRIQQGYFGVCLESGQPINRARLEAKPWARYCIEVARERERRGLPST